MGSEAEARYEEGLLNEPTPEEIMYKDLASAMCPKCQSFPCMCSHIESLSQPIVVMDCPKCREQIRQQLLLEIALLEDILKGDEKP